MTIRISSRLKQAVKATPPYEGPDGAKLEDHSKRKHKILREYVFDYLTVRCKLPQRERFRLAIVDGFAGGGRYQCGSPGSPLIFIEELKRGVEAVNTHRTVQGLGMIEVECLLIFNDASLDAVELLKGHVAPMQADIAATCPRLHLRVEYLNEFFEVAYPRIKGLLEQGRYKNVLFNLDQCGDSHVNRETIIDIMRSYASAEIFYTFMISTLLAFLKKDQPDQLTKRLDYYQGHRHHVPERRCHAIWPGVLTPNPYIACTPRAWPSRKRRPIHQTFVAEPPHCPR